MTKRNIQKTSIFTKDIRKLHSKIQYKSWEIVQILADDIFDKSLDIKKLHGYKNVWRVVVAKDYRLIYTFDEANIYLLRIAHRKDIYRKNIDFDF